jgi:L-lactate dehydrogenase complex protein LldF
VYALLAAAGARALAWMGGADKRIRDLPAAREWTLGRDMPAAEGKTFRKLYAERRAASNRK